MKKSALTLAVLSAMSANSFANVIYTGENNQINFSGDVEFDVSHKDDRSNNALNGGNHKPWYQNDHRDENNIDGRILLEIEGVQQLDSGNYAGFRVQPLLNIGGSDGGTVGLDDVEFSFGQQNSWSVKVGRFEAYDMFPLGDDIFVDYVGNTSDSMYRDGSGYVYMMNEARGRSDSAGQMLYNFQSGGFYFEMATMIGNRANLFGDNYSDKRTYHGYNVEDRKNSVLVRPVVAYNFGNLVTVALGAERNLVDDAVVMEIDKAQQHYKDISDREGYGATINFNNGVVDANFNSDETNQSFGANVVYNGFGLGYIHAFNDIDIVKTPEQGNEHGAVAGMSETQTLYTSYRFADVMSVKDFDIYLSAYHSRFSPDSDTTNGKDTKETGTKVRFNYRF
ncbi:hypothetical protein ACH42_04285 [Endozoicomonas sp. (ex Bugula neritina AB1)]|nr:hypothetical protein ACH42_04285 [Endozoicomonas sp. (ex Bugula neritina AB1)]